MSILYGIAYPFLDFLEAAIGTIDAIEKPGMTIQLGQSITIGLGLVLTSCGCDARNSRADSVPMLTRRLEAQL
jgi:hypothetical protein